MNLVAVDLDSVPVGMLVYEGPGLPIGWVGTHLAMNGNGPAKKERCLDTGKPKDRFAYRRLGLYREWRHKKVFVDATRNKEES